MSRVAVIANILRFVGMLLVQVLVLKRVTLGWEAFPYVQILLYPLFILLLPLRVPRPLVILTSFAMGILVDMFYNSWGIHASASVFTAFIRPFILNRLEPRGGYTAAHAPNKERMGWAWFLRYAAFLLAFHLFFYFSVESFTFVYIIRILLNTFFSFIVTFIFILIYMQVFNPKE
ncbi:MAG: hypothetical protein ACK4TA_13615 [Saprospiraceae bacterium]